MLALSLQAAVIGLAAGYVAWALYALISIVTNAVFFQRWGTTLPSLEHNHLGLWILIVPAVSGLIIGLMAKYGSTKIRGHGIPEAMEAVLTNRSRIEPRVAILKPLSAALAIGTGGPFGAEGPIIQTGGALGSLLGQVLRTTAAERRVLLACGAAAGMAGVFGTPIAAVIMAIELLLFEFRSRSFIPLVIASTMATTVHVAIFGYGPLFHVISPDFAVPRALPLYILLGIIAGLAATGLSRALYWVEDTYERLRFDPMWFPVIGGVALGVIGLFQPRVLGVGYDVISDLLNDKLVLTAVAGILVWKTIALLVSLGSGTSGGLLAPTLMIGAALGGTLAHGANAIFPAAHLSAGAFALVGMAAVFGSASRSTFAFIIFAFELTRDYDAVLPLMLACVVADAIARRLMPNSIMTEKLARRGLKVHAEFEADVLKQVNVGDVMETPALTRPSSMPLATLAQEMAPGGAIHGRHCVLLVSESGALEGIVTRSDVVEALTTSERPPHTVLEAGTPSPLTTTSGESVHDALEIMMLGGVGRLPVVDASDATKVVGYLSREGVLAARERRLKEERDRESGWLSRMPFNARGNRESA
ncbi:MAG TPA: chloride channel protein [Gemmatimonadales bacterium]|jgi:H+/Cl- antiporter ClcA